MNEGRQEILFDLLAKKAVYGLDDAEQAQFNDLDPGTTELEFHTLEITAAAISMVGLEPDEPLPAHLRSSIIANASSYMAGGATVEDAPWPRANDRVLSAYDSADAYKRGGSWFSWFGWAAAATACIALAVNIWFTWQKPQEQVKNSSPANVPNVLTPAQKRDALMSSSGIVKANWAAGNVKEMKQVSGDVVWSDDKQEGYMLLKGLARNDTSKETYQLWIYDKTQDKKNPIDGGIFDVTADGDVVIPINAKLKASGPSMFAITIEKPGGVVVSKGEKIAVLAQVETKTG